MGRWMFCSVLVSHVRHMSSHLILDVYALFLDGFRLLRAVVNVFEVVVDGCKWF